MSQARRTRHFARNVKRVGSSGSGILVKKGAEGKCGNAGKRECGIRTSLSRPYLKQVLLTYKDTNQNSEKNVQPVNVDKGRK